MNKICGILFIGLSILGCKEKEIKKQSVVDKIEFNASLADELKRMEKADQIAAYIPQGEYAKLSKK
jgi:hypothetical protein